MKVTCCMLLQVVVSAAIVVMFVLELVNMAFISNVKESLLWVVVVVYGYCFKVVVKAQPGNHGPMGLIRKYEFLPRGSAP